MLRASEVCCSARAAEAENQHRDAGEQGTQREGSVAHRNRHHGREDSHQRQQAEPPIHFGARRGERGVRWRQSKRTGVASKVRRVTWVSLSLFWSSASAIGSGRRALRFFLRTHCCDRALTKKGTFSSERFPEGTSGVRPNPAVLVPDLFDFRQPAPQGRLAGYGPRQLGGLRNTQLGRRCLTADCTGGATRPA